MRIHSLFTSNDDEDIALGINILLNAGYDHHRIHQFFMKYCRSRYIVLVMHPIDKYFRVFRNTSEYSNFKPGLIIPYDGD